MRANIDPRNFPGRGIYRRYGPWVGLILLGLLSGRVLAAGLVAGQEIPLPNCQGWVQIRPFGVLTDPYAAYHYIHGLPVNPAGGYFRFKAQFPKQPPSGEPSVVKPGARYISWQNYGGLLVNYTNTLADYEIVPDTGNNPFQIGVDDPVGTYTVDLLDRKLVQDPNDPAKRICSRLPQDPGPNVLCGGYQQNGTAFATNEPVYRVYLPQEPTTVPTKPITLNTPSVKVGGVPLPQLYFVVTDPKKTSVLAIQAMCARIRIAQEVWAAQNNNPSSQGLPSWLMPPSPPPSASPAPVRYQAVPPLSNGLGIGSNGEIGYLRMFLDAQPEIVVLKFRAATVPRIEQGQARTGSEETRYWSFCTQKDSLFGLFGVTADCKYDGNVDIVNEDGVDFVRLALSSPENKPTNAGNNWLPFTSQAILRHLQPDPVNFPEALLFFDPQDANDEALIRTHMGDYFPRYAYCTKAQFQANDVACFDYH